MDELFPPDGGEARISATGALRADAAALAIGALGVATSIFLIEEMGSPLEGIIVPSAAPLRDALRVLGK